MGSLNAVNWDLIRPLERMRMVSVLGGSKVSILPLRICELEDRRGVLEEMGGAVLDDGTLAKDPEVCHRDCDQMDGSGFEVGGAGLTAMGQLVAAELDEVGSAAQGFALQSIAKHRRTIIGRIRLVYRFSKKNARPASQIIPHSALFGQETESLMNSKLEP